MSNNDYKSIILKKLVSDSILKCKTILNNEVGKS